MENFFEAHTICIKEGEKIYKIFTITGEKDGSINVHMPYCKTKEGYVSQYDGHPGKTREHAEKRRINRSFTVSQNAKLSIHRSGFVQFSGEGILSGIDKETGKIKGLGIWSAPLDTPISSGPTGGVTCWGLDKGFETKELIEKKKRRYVILEPKDFIFRKSIGRNSANTYLLEIFIFHPDMKTPLKETERGTWMTLSFLNYKDPGAIFTFPVALFKTVPNRIGIVPFKVYTEFPEKMDFGYMVAGPAGQADEPQDKRKLQAISCSYPAIFDDGDTTPTLDYKSS